MKLTRDSDSYKNIRSENKKDMARWISIQTYKKISRRHNQNIINTPITTLNQQLYGFNGFVLNNCTPTFNWHIVQKAFCVAGYNAVNHGREL